MGGLPGPRQHPFGLGITLSSRLCVPAAFRLLAFASWTFLLPLEYPATLTGVVLTTVRFQGGYHVPHQGETMGVGALFTPGSGCPHRDFCVSLVPSDPVLPSWSTIVRQPYMTKPHREFIRIHPSHLSLGRFVRMARTPLGLYPWLRTPPLPVTHAGIGNRHGHLPGSHDHSPGAASCRTQKL